MPLFQYHVFVCTNRRPEGHPRGCCSAKGSESLRETLKVLVKQRGLDRSIRINTAGCLDQCEHGVTVVIYPDAVWYGFVQTSDLEEIVQSHLVDGRPVQRLRLPEACINTPTCRHRASGMQLGRE